MRLIMAGAATLALAASGAFAQGQGIGKGQGNGKGNGPAATQSKGNGGPGKAGRDPLRAAQAERGKGNGNGNQGKRGNGNRDADRGPDRATRDIRGNGDRRASVNGRDAVDVRVRYDDRGPVIGVDRDYRWLARDRQRTLVDGCPPGLAKKRNGCNPPGQLRARDQRSLYGSDYRPGLFGLTNYDRRGNYYYNDGYLVQYGNGGIASWLPLLGGALGIGNVWPTGYRSYDVPDYYVDYYDLGGPDRYRYADNVIYRVDPEDAAITSIAALITGDEFTVGQPVPRGYDVYNVPYAYRDRYYDTPEYQYRYSDGYVYRIDPETQLVAAAIDLLI